jgi:TPR repeat protein
MVLGPNTRELAHPEHRSSSYQAAPRRASGRVPPVWSDLVLLLWAAALLGCGSVASGLRGDSYEPIGVKECSTSELLARAGNPDWARSTRIDAVFELGRRTDEASQVVPALVALAQDPATESRIYVLIISVLGNMGPAAGQAVPALVDQIPKALSRTVKIEGHVYAAAVSASLKKITGQDFGNDERRWRKWAGLPETRTSEEDAPAQATKLACENGNTKACNELGTCYRLGQCRLPMAVAKAQEAYQKACDAGDMEGCTNLGSCYRSGDCNADKDPARARALYERACDGGSMAGCASLGSCYQEGDCGPAEDTSRAVGLYRKACEGGNVDACSNLGQCYLTGGCGLERDEERGSVLIQKACEIGNDFGACHNLGVCYLEGICRGAEHRQRAGAAFRAACDAEMFPSCTNLGVCYAEGDCGVPKDELRAGQLFEKACKDGNDKAGCANLRADRGKRLRRVLGYMQGTLFWADRAPSPAR